MHKEKPSKKERLKEKEKIKHDLKSYRALNAALCIERDAGLCVIHYFLKNKRVPYHHIHHVRGRGKTAGDERENYKSLMCVCTACHPQPAQNDYGKQEWVIDILNNANDTPINGNFKHQ